MSSSHQLSLRTEFIHTSITFLFQTTYHPKKDDLRVLTLLTYLNAAMPPGRYEDFDIQEVRRALEVLREKGYVYVDEVRDLVGLAEL